MTGLRPSRRSRIAPFVVMEVLEEANARAAQGVEVLHLELGEPGEGTPPSALEAARRALAEAPMGYTEALGLPALRQRIAQHYLERHGVEVEPRRIAVTVGASGAFVLGFLAAFDAGARVALAEPGYPAYRNILHALDVEVVRLDVGFAEGFQPTVAALERALPLDGLVLASPANPTGSMITPERLEELRAFCTERGIRIVSDEIYHGITFGPSARTLAGDPHAIVVNSFSKYFCMTGWRLGWMVIPEDLLVPVARLAQNLFISPPTVAQHAALGAFRDRALLDARVEAYRRNRDRLLAALREGGVERVAPPEGAFYLYADISDFGLDSPEFCRRLLDETGVAATPGVDFDPVQGHRYVRFSFAASEDVVAEACRRLVPWLHALRAGT
ncbi:Aspartate aminotransferase [bacterium HR39]|nr:Aspartate aminotransferase [bacterium HR39]